MTTELAQERARRATWIVAAAAILAIIAATTVGIQMRSRDAEQVAGPVLPAFSQRLKDAARITIVSKDARYEIQRTEKGWALKDRGNYPVRRERLAQFTDGLRSLAFVRPMTRDPERHERLGLGDPAAGGSGVLVQVEDSRGARLADLVLGPAPGGALFMRRPDEAQTWEVRGDMPPLRDPAQWLDLVPFELPLPRVASAEVAPAVGPPYTIARPTVEGAFALAPPHDGREVIAPMGLGGTASALAELRPTDVRPAAAIGGAPQSRVRMRTFDGLYVDGEIFQDAGGKHWIKLIVRADTPEQMMEAQTLNQRAAPWAYGLSASDAQTVAPPLDTLVAVPDPPPAPPARPKRR